MALDNEKLTERPALTNSQDTDVIHVVRNNVSYQKEAQNFRAGSLGNINDIDDVNAPSPQTNNFLKWDTTTNKWIANAIQLGDLLDVVIDDNTLVNGQVITYDSGNEEWVNTTIPTSTNFLPLAGGTMTGNTLHGDNVKSVYGDDGDLEIYHNGNASIIKDAGVGNLQINASSFVLNNSADTSNMIIAIDGGATSLYCAGALKLATTSNGVNVTNTLNVLGDGATEQGILKLYCENGNAHYVGIKGGDHAGASSYTLQLPNALPNVTNQILESDENGELSWINTPSDSATFTGLTDTPASYNCQDGKNVKVAYTDTGGNPTELEFVPDYFDFACSDEDTDLAVGIVFTMICNRAYPLASAVEFSVTTAPTGSTLGFDVRKNGTTVYTTPPTIDAGEKLTATATTQQAIIGGSNFSLAIGDEFQVRITQVGSTVAGAGLKATMVYNDRVCI